MIQNVKIVQRIDTGWDFSTFNSSVDEIFPEQEGYDYEYMKVRNDIQQASLLLDGLDDILLPHADERGMNALVFKDESNTLEKQCSYIPLVRNNPELETHNQYKRMVTPSFSVMPSGVFQDGNKDDELGTDVIEE